MVDSLNIEFDPQPEVIVQRLEKYGDVMKGKALDSGMTAAAKPVKDSMKRLAPKGTGALKKSIGQVKLNKRGRSLLNIPQGKKAIMVGPVRKVYDPNYQRPGSSAKGKKIHQGYKAYWIEETGAKPHTIPLRRKNRKTLKLSGWSYGTFYTRVKHKGFRPDSFIAPAVAQTKSSMPQKFYAGVNRRLDKFDARP